MITVVACTTKRELKLFERIPEKLHGNNPYYVPPFPGSITKVFSDKHPFSRQGEIYPYIAFKDGKPAGRIAAIVNRYHNEYHKDKTGFFGFLDFIDDSEVVSELVTTAKNELLRNELTSMRGPYNPSINDECGLLVDGFDSTPFITMPYNPPYYLERYEEVGLKKARDLCAYYISATTQSPERMNKIVNRVKKSTGIKFRNINLKKLESELVVFKDIYNDTLKRNWGFLPITMEDMEFAAEDLKAVADPKMIIVAEKDGVPIGFSMAMPNINELLWKTRKLPILIRILKFVWLLKTSTPKEARLMVLGVKPEYRNKGIGSVFYYESLYRAKGVYAGGEMSWIDESNTEIMKAIELIGGHRYKSYRIYEKEI